MIYANLVSCRVLVSLRDGTSIIADDELTPIIAAEGYVESAGAGYMRLQTHAVHTNYEDSSERIEGEEPMELLLGESAILLVQLLEEGDTIETDDEDRSPTGESSYDGDGAQP